MSALGAAGTVVAELSQVANAGFVSKLSADGATLEFSSYLRAHATPEVFQFFAGEPAAMLGQTYIALDKQGNVVLAGATRGVDLPAVNQIEGHAGLEETFVGEDCR